MARPKSRNQTSDTDVDAFTKDVSLDEKRTPLTTAEREDPIMPQPLVKIVNLSTGDVIQASLAELNQQMLDFKKVVLLIEDQPHASDVCTKALHDLGFDGVQLITNITEAGQHFDDIVEKLTTAPAAIVLDLGLGNDSGFTLLRQCHAEPRLQNVPILVWTKDSDDLARTFSMYLGAQDFLLKSDDPAELRSALQRLMGLVAH
jgi:CheY-like chemotaxis protein